MPSKRNRDKGRAIAQQKRDLGEGTGQVRPRSQTLLRAEAQVTHYRGPLPPLEVLREFDDIVPGSAATMLGLFEDQARHRMDLEKRTIGSDILQSRLGLAAACVLTIFITGEGGVLIWNGHGVEGLATVVSAVAALVGVFVYGTKSRKEERMEKAERQAELRDLPPGRSP